MVAVGDRPAGVADDTQFPTVILSHSASFTDEDSTLGIAGLILFYPAFNIPDLIALMDQFGGFGGGSWGISNNPHELSSRFTRYHYKNTMNYENKIL